MRAATPKADSKLRRAGARPDGGADRTSDTVHPFPGAGLAGVRPFRPGRDAGPFARPPANDAARVTQRPLPPLLLGALVVLLDALALIGAGAIANLLTGQVEGRHGNVILLVTGLALAGGLVTGAYDHPMLFRFRRQVRRAGAGALAALTATLAAAAAFGVLWRLDPAWLAVVVPVGATCLALSRGIAFALVNLAPRTARRTVILGSGIQAQRLAAALRRDPAGLELVGLVDERGARAAEPPEGVPLLGGMPQLAAMIRRGEVEVVVIALPWSSEARVAELCERFSAFPVELRIAPDLVAARLPRDYAPALPPLLCARPISGLGGTMKVASDYLVATAALLVTAIPMLMIAIAVKLDSPGPVLFRQKRIGFNDGAFDCFKFRTMYHDASDYDAARQVLAGDPRVTRIGAILRRTSLDELPQLFNVLRGEMSFVGPRPHAPGTRAGNRRFDEVVANYAARHRVKPGLTGLAQVRGYRGPTPTEDGILRRVESDLEYIANWSL